MYAVFKSLHIIGVVVLLGNVTITAFWKVLADRTSDARLIAHAQHGVTVADWIFTLAGIVLVLVGGYGAAVVAGLSVTNLRGSSSVNFCLPSQAWSGLRF